MSKHVFQGFWKCHLKKGEMEVQILKINMGTVFMVLWVDDYENNNDFKIQRSGSEIPPLLFPILYAIKTRLLTL
jgi:hypothetical protein